ncbi:DUF6456 domain-containing protein [Rhodovulum sp. DZ06]|uniref:DUF6456 domain-containing protein n=1 Tax=Rhodovulum sp. DZ06 TaxID=3425126 RepID=UPI003D32DB83
MHSQIALEGCIHAVRRVYGPGTDPRRLAEAEDYIAHTVGGVAMRDLARRRGVHPSTVMRTVRRLETRRDDPLHDVLLTEAEALLARSGGAEAYAQTMETALPQISVTDSAADPASPRAAQDADKALEKDARRILRRLSEPRAFLAIAQGAESACVFRPGPEGPVTLAKLPARSAAAMAARDWIGCAHRGRNLAKYEITEAGRAWLRRALAGDGDARRRAAERGGVEAAMELAEGPSVFARQHQVAGSRRVVDDQGAAREMQVNMGETPLGWLARRKGADGRPFLTAEEVVAGERLREDFERAQAGPKIAQDWSRFLASVDESARGAGRGPAEGPAAARERLAQALEALGPGLNDAALRACCFLEGLEATERRMGWAARSGKVVLKIALGRLAQHYGLSGLRAAV